MEARDSSKAATFPPKVKLSYSFLNELQICERLFQLDFLLNSNIREDSATFSAGHCFGNGVASYFLHGDQDRALYEAWLSYWPQIEDEKKNQPRMFMALYAAFGKIDTLREDYEVAYFKGKPAAELAFKLNIDETFFFTGHIDLVIRNKWTGVYYIFECKHTGLQLFDLSPLYKNSGQALGYSIVLDQIVGEQQSSYGVLYFAAQLKNNFETTIHVMPYDKTLLDRLNWFITLGLDVEKLHRMEKLQVYPKRGGSCLKYNKPCKHFGTCGLTTLDEPKPYVEDTEVYDFEYNLDDLVADHLRRIG